jgi:hypothetical protein
MKRVEIDGDVEARVGEGQTLAVRLGEMLVRDPLSGAGTGEHLGIDVDAGSVGAVLGEEAHERAVAAADIEDAPSWQGEQFTQDIAVAAVFHRARTLASAGFAVKRDSL